MAQEVVPEDLIVETHVVSHHRTVADKSQKPCQRLFRLEQFANRHLLMIERVHRVFFLAEQGRDGAVGLNIEVEWLAHYPALADPHGRDLDDIVMIDVRARGLGVENHDFASIVCLEKLLEVGGGAVVAQEVVGRKGKLEKFSRETPSKGVGVENADTVQDTRPGDEVVLVGEYG